MPGLQKTSQILALPEINSEFQFRMQHHQERNYTHLRCQTIQEHLRTQVEKRSAVARRSEPSAFFTRVFAIGNVKPPMFAPAFTSTPLIPSKTLVRSSLH